LDVSELARWVAEQERQRRELLNPLDLSPMFEAARRVASIGASATRDIERTIEAITASADRTRKLFDCATAPAIDLARRLQDDDHKIMRAAEELRRTTEGFASSLAENVRRSYVSIAPPVPDRWMDDMHRMHEHIRASVPKPPFYTPPPPLEIPPLPALESVGEGWRDQQDRIDELEDRVAELEARLEELNPPPPPPPPDDPDLHTGQYL
jgi:hypothetical protein